MEKFGIKKNSTVLLIGNTYYFPLRTRKEALNSFHVSRVLSQSPVTWRHKHGERARGHLSRLPEPLDEPWAQRRFTICAQPSDTPNASTQRLIAFLRERASTAG